MTFTSGWVYNTYHGLGLCWNSETPHGSVGLSAAGSVETISERNTYGSGTRVTYG